MERLKVTVMTGDDDDIYSRGNARDDDDYGDTQFTHTTSATTTTSSSTNLTSQSSLSIPRRLTFVLSSSPRENHTAAPSSASVELCAVASCYLDRAAIGKHVLGP